MRLNPTMNKAQQQALANLFARSYGTAYEGRKHLLRHYRAFRRTANYSHVMGCWMIQWCGMWIGIERDGYTHS